MVEAVPGKQLKTGPECLAVNPDIFIRPDILYPKDRWSYA
ncbi:MAG: hypothetical protein OP8BY_1991 [Candidatus Saccharicenans subterraneus]|uniref:Uncharacterized protein n=1 Tax=Candidatus Saccharicenans subterraneus TaxID=2508984 RepID=A0A3E2BMK4_9BACT|nr:MAG: hypothetical protein OP8BY_1991 [Candidatus Saccharicenans subterraneum]